MSKKAIDPNEFKPTVGNLDRIIHSPARLSILTFLYVVDEGDMTYLLGQTGLTWGNLSVNVQKLKEAGYISVNKSFKDNKPLTWVRMTDEGRQAFRAYRNHMKGILDNLPE